MQQRQDTVYADFKMKCLVICFGEPIDLQNTFGNHTEAQNSIKTTQESKGM